MHLKPFMRNIMLEFFDLENQSQGHGVCNFKLRHLKDASVQWLDNR